MVDKRMTTRRVFLTRGILGGGLLLAGPVFVAACSSEPASGAAGSGSSSAGASGSGSSAPGGAVVTGTTAAPTSAGGPQRGGTLTFAISAGAITVDPTAVGDNGSIWTVSTMFDRLYQSTPSGSTGPSLATGHTLSDDGLTWTFPLRDGLTFSDGSPITAADVKFSIDRSTKSDENGYMNVAIAEVTAPDDKTVVIKTSYPTDLIGVVSYFSNGVLPKDFGGKSEKDFFAAPVASGPFTMTAWQKGQKLTLTRNEHYWQPGKPYVDSVEFLDVSDDNSRILQLQGGKVDLIDSPPWSQVQALQAQSTLAVQKYDSTLVYFLNLSQQFKPLADPHVRDAINTAINRDALVKVALFGSGQAAGSLFTPSWPDYDASLKPVVQDIAKAKQLLAQSSQPKGFEVEFAIVGGDVVQTTVAQQIQADLQQIGITVTIKNFDPNTLEDMFGKGQYQIYFDSLSLDVMDDFENVPYAVDPAAGGEAASADYKDADLISWATEAGKTTDPDKEKELYQKIQKRIYDVAPFLPLYYVPYVYAMSKKVNNLVVPPTGDWRLEDVWLTK